MTPAPARRILDAVLLLAATAISHHLAVLATRYAYARIIYHKHAQHTINAINLDLSPPRVGDDPKPG